MISTTPPRTWCVTTTNAFFAAAVLPPATRRAFPLSAQTPAALTRTSARRSTKTLPTCRAFPAVSASSTARPARLLKKTTPTRCSPQSMTPKNLSLSTPRRPFAQRSARRSACTSAPTSRAKWLPRCAVWASTRYLTPTSPRTLRLSKKRTNFWSGSKTAAFCR